MDGFVDLILLNFRFFSESHEEAAETPTTPTNEGAGPHIPEPDYDMSDVDNVDQGDNQSYSGSESGSWRDTTATLRRNARRPSNEAVAKQDAAGAPCINRCY